MVNGKICLGTSELTEAERLRGHLAKRGVTLVIIHNAATCSKGCAITVEMWANEGDLAAIGEVVAEQRMKRLEGLDFDPSLLNQVFDPERESATCPACGTSFATTRHECPDCGLVLYGDSIMGGGGCS